jgi:hypothetical protein
VAADQAFLDGPEHRLDGFDVDVRALSRRESSDWH